MPEELKDVIAENAQQPVEVEIDGQRFKQHPIRDQIAAARFAAGEKAKKARNRGLGSIRTVPPGTV
jgi:hypothetical protein